MGAPAGAAGWEADAAGAYEEAIDGIDVDECDELGVIMEVEAI